MKTKKNDPRMRRALLSYDVNDNINKRGAETFFNQLVLDCAILIAAISERSSTPGLDGHKKNYLICRRIAELKIKLEQATMVWSRDNIEQFERSIMGQIEDSVRARRAMRPRCQTCGRPLRDGVCVKCFDINEMPL